MTDKLRTTPGVFQRIEFDMDMDVFFNMTFHCARDWLMHWVQATGDQLHRSTPDMAHRFRLPLPSFTAATRRRFPDDCRISKC